MKRHTGSRWIPAVMLAMAAGAALGCAAQGASQPDVKTLESEKVALQQQLASMAPTMVVQAGQLAVPPPAAQPSGWETAEAIRGRIRLHATYDSSGPDAWDVRAHPTVFFTTEGVGSNPKGGTRKSGVMIIDAYTKQVVGSALYDLGEEVTQNPHGAGMSPDGRWLYIGQMHRVKATGQERTVLLIINARTLKLDKVLEGTARVDWFHHITAFKDWQGRDRILVAFGRTPGGAPHYLLDPHDDNRVARAVTVEDIGYKVGHPYPTMDPTFRIMFVSIIAPPWRGQLHNTGGIAKLNLATGVATIIPWVGDNPIGMAHTADGRFTYVNDSEGSSVFKIDNQSNSVVDHINAGVTGPYGMALNWDESLIYTVGKGEGGHNRGSVLGVLSTRPFGQAPRTLHNMPIWLGGSASSVDHAVLHPDPKVNELWISNMNGWEMIVLDLNTHQVKGYIATPNGGDTHAGGFVRYTPDWKGELLADMGGPKGPMQAMMGKMAAAAQASVAAAAPVTAFGDGRALFEKTAGGMGCALCHGADARGGAQFNAPDIRGADEARIRSALVGVTQMSRLRLTDTEISAVVRHLQMLNKQP